MAAPCISPMLISLRTNTSRLSLSTLRASTPSFTFRLCPQCRCAVSRPFSAFSKTGSNAKRLLMTDSVGAYRPHSLDPGPPPPRGTGVAESSIAGGLPQDGKQAQDVWSSIRSSNPEKYEESMPEQQRSPLKISESDAQQPRPVPQPPVQQSQSTTLSKPQRPVRSKLRARKAAMTLTPAAVSHLRELLNEPEPKLIRVGVKNKGCSGSAYSLEYVDKPAMFDEQIEQDGVKVLIDSKALIKVIGSEMDWVEDKLSARFTFRNPNITEQCGCGESFSIS